LYCFLKALTARLHLRGGCGVEPAPQDTPQCAFLRRSQRRQPRQVQAGVSTATAALPTPPPQPAPATRQRTPKPRCTAAKTNTRNHYAPTSQLTTTTHKPTNLADRTTTPANTSTPAHSDSRSNCSISTSRKPTISAVTNARYRRWSTRATLQALFAPSSSFHPTATFDLQSAPPATTTLRCSKPPALPPQAPACASMPHSTSKAPHRLRQPYNAENRQPCAPKPCFSRCRSTYQVTISLNKEPTNIVLFFSRR
jgi:hypothetical protein